MKLRATPFWRFLSACYGLCVNLGVEIALRCAVPAQAARTRLVAAGLPLQRQVLVLQCMDGSQASGLFTEFASVLGALEHCERWENHYAGFRVDFADHGLYYDPGAGPNWWEYYFEPINIGSPGGTAAMTITRWQHDAFAIKVERRMSRPVAAAILARHVRVKPYLREQVDSYVRENFDGRFVIGIHYRGTDKHEEAPRVPYADVEATVRKVIGRAGTDQYRLYVATDEQYFLDYMLGRFPGKVLYRELLRSTDGRPTHKTSGGGFKKGADAVIDCLLLSRCGYLVRTASDLSLCATFINPDLPQILLNLTQER
jgi:hypothetical protein